MIWKRTFSITDLNKNRTQSHVNHLGIEFDNFGDDWLSAKMPVDHRTIQPYGILHGGASVSLAETVGSVASLLCLPDNSNRIPVGLEINANHLKIVTKGNVTAIATPISIGNMVHVWNIEIQNEKKQLICIARLTIMIIDKK
jgi:uncharacterized protein (TIGR00369 family)